jgi:hypothetical protein
MIHLYMAKSYYFAILKKRMAILLLQDFSLICEYLRLYKVQK